MITRNKTSLLLASLVAATFCTAGISEAGKPTVAGTCKKCHTAQPDTVRGKLGKVSKEFNTLQVKAGKIVWIVNYDDKTSVVKGDKTQDQERGADRQPGAAAAPARACPIGEKAVYGVVEGIDESIAQQHSRPLFGCDAQAEHVECEGKRLEHIDRDGCAKHTNGIVERLCTWF